MAPKRKAKAVAAAPKADHAGPSDQPAPKRRRGAKEAERRPAGDCFCFGTGAFGQLGLGEDKTVKYRPSDMVDLGGSKAVEVSCGGMHTAALTEEGAVYTWGVNDEGALGRPTEGTAWEDTEDEKKSHALPGLARLPAGVRVVQVACGDGFSFVLTEDGAVWGCGCFKDESGGTEGFPGIPSGEKRARLPVKVLNPASARERVIKIAAGSRHMAALNRRGEVLTWGFGAQGQLGRVPKYQPHNTPPLEQLLVPQVVPGVGTAYAGDVLDIGCGAYSTFAVVGRTGAVVAWGLNNTGQLAIPKEQHQPPQQEPGEPMDGMEQQQQQQQQATDMEGVEQQQQQQQMEMGGQPAQTEEDKRKAKMEQCVWAPMHVEALDGVAAIAGGDHHTLALTKQGHVLSFGEPTYGMLGREGEDTNAAGVILAPGRVADGTDEGLGEDVVMVAAGPDVSAAVVKGGGNAFFWGSNVSYQLAKGQDDDDCLVPTKMKRPAMFGRRPVAALSFGGQHVALLALEPQDAPAAAAAGVEAAPAAAEAAAAIAAAAVAAAQVADAAAAAVAAADAAAEAHAAAEADAAAADAAAEAQAADATAEAAAAGASGADAAAADAAAAGASGADAAAAEAAAAGASGADAAAAEAAAAGASGADAAAVQALRTLRHKLRGNADYKRQLRQGGLADPQLLLNGLMHQLAQLGLSVVAGDAARSGSGWQAGFCLRQEQLPLVDVMAAGAATADAAEAIRARLALERLGLVKVALEAAPSTQG